MLRSRLNSSAANSASATKYLGWGVPHFHLLWWGCQSLWKIPLVDDAIFPSAYPQSVIEGLPRWPFPRGIIPLGNPSLFDSISHSVWKPGWHELLKMFLEWSGLDT